MPAKHRSLRSVFPQEYSATLPNLLVSGCSYTWNNSEEHPVTWPYYLRDIVGFTEVFDCSQAGSGSNLAYTSIINELECNVSLTPENTMVIVMWSSLPRIDILAPKKLVDSWANMPTHVFDYQQRFSNLSIWWRESPENTNREVEKLRSQYQKIIGPGPQILQSIINIIALHNYLKNRGFKSVLLTWELFDEIELSDIDSHLTQRIKELIAPIETLGEYATRTQSRILGDGHPSVHAHLNWTQQVLIPYLHSQQIIKSI